MPGRKTTKAAYKTRLMACADLMARHQWSAEAFAKEWGISRTQAYRDRTNVLESMEKQEHERRGADRRLFLMKLAQVQARMIRDLPSKGRADVRLYREITRSLHLEARVLGLEIPERDDVSMASRTASTSDPIERLGALAEKMALMKESGLLDALLKIGEAPQVIEGHRANPFQHPTPPEDGGE